ncbi:flavin monoamine oxidase family protein [Silvanigrella sp.]|jgi:monoamine oxidase|uniref:flavin monoamine oxidase family protein n=1 Tax=Silvanigrella sp. TaxID=2024976 RepID=UPI0037C945DD
MVVKNSRRDFLKNTTILSSGLFFNSRISAISDNYLDIAVVGSGVSGLTFCYLLKNQKMNIQMFESNNSRLGGRIQTILNFNSDHQHVELGGEHINSDQLYTLKLCKELNLKLIEDNIHDNISKDIYFAHNEKKSKLEIFQEAKKLGIINKKILDKYTNNNEVNWPDYKTNQDAWKEFDNLSASEYLEKYAKDIEPWFIHILNKAYSALMGPDMSEISSIVFLQVFPTDFSSEEKFTIYSGLDEKYSIDGGNIKLIETLKVRLSNKIKINMGYDLIRISDKVTYFLLTFITPFGTKEIKAKKIVMAIPLGALRKVEGFDKLELNPIKLKNIKELGFGSNGKLILNFENRFWANETSEPKLLKRFATDELGGCFWEPTQFQKGNMGALNTWFGGNFGKKINKNLIKETLEFYNKVWPNSKTFYNNKFVEKYWIEDKYTHGSYSFPLKGQMTTIYGNFNEPELNNRLFFIGEHTSYNNYGYIEGAVESAINTAKKYFLV